MTDEYFNALLENRNERYHCEQVLERLNSESKTFEFCFVSPSEDAREPIKENVYCHDWLRDVIRSAVETRMNTLDAEFKEL